MNDITILPTLNISHAGVHICIIRRDDAIELQYENSETRRVTDIALQPVSLNCIQLKVKENMR